MALRLLCFLLVLLSVTYVSARPRAKGDSYDAYRDFYGPQPSRSIDDGDVKPLALAETRHASRNRGYGRPQGSRPHEYAGPIGTKTSGGASKRPAGDPPKARPVDDRPKARPARIRPHPKGRITINGKEEPVIKTHGKVHSCKSGFQWDKCNAISHNLKCELCFPKVPLKFELCQESHRGNSKRCLEALYWMFKQKVNAIKRRFPHWRERQQAGQTSRNKGGRQGQTPDRRHGPYNNRRPGHRGNRYPEFFRGDNMYPEQRGKQYAGGMRKRV